MWTRKDVILGMFIGAVAGFIFACIVQITVGLVHTDKTPYYHVSIERNK